MPELPEVETVRRGLETLVGREVNDVVVTGSRSVRRQHPEEFAARLVGRRLVGARRRGKYLLVDLDDGAVLVVHLRMSGQLLHVPAGEPLAPHTHVRLLFGPDELRFVDPRTFGELFVTERLDEHRVPSVLAGLGIDPLQDGVSASSLSELAAGRQVAVKTFLLDQRHLCGIGNLYADEICFRARIAPLRPIGTLSRARFVALAAAIEEVLTEAVALRGSSLRDLRYRDLAGGYGAYQHHHAVYDREGEPCPTCGRPIGRAKVSGRSTYFCRRCQR